MNKFRDEIIRTVADRENAPLGNTTILLKQAALPEYYDIAAGAKINQCCYATLTPMTGTGLYFPLGGKVGAFPTHQKRA